MIRQHLGRSTPGICAYSRARTAKSLAKATFRVLAAANVYSAASRAGGGSSAGSPLSANSSSPNLASFSRASSASRCLFPHTGVKAVRRQKLHVSPALGDAPALQHKNLVSANDGGQTVRDHKRGAVARHLFKLVLDFLLGVAVERRCRLVQHQD